MDIGTLSWLRRRCEAGVGFLTTYVRTFEAGHHVEIRTESDIDSLPYPQRMWFEYAVSTNLRGRDLIGELERYKPLRGRRYLDVGCGFGGCVVAAARRGAGAVGIEVDPERVGFALWNIFDSGLAANILLHDITDPELASKIGTFDAITCNDVAEHVASAPDLIRNLSRLLAKGGVLYLEIPNPHAIEFVIRDGHFGLFGITLLPREEAMSYHAMRFRAVYDVGHYHTLPEYLQMFRECELTAELVPSLYHPTREIAETPQLLRGLSQALAEFLADSGNGAVSWSVIPAVERYLDELRQDLWAAQADGRAEAQRRLKPAPQSFRNKYLRQFWTLVVRKE